VRRAPFEESGRGGVDLGDFERDVEEDGRGAASGSMQGGRWYLEATFVKENFSGFGRRKLRRRVGPRRRDLVNLGFRCAVCVKGERVGGARKVCR